MGSAVGERLALAGYRVVTALDGRSAHSRDLAAAAGLEDLGSLDAVIAAANIFLSIVPPAVAFDLAGAAASCIRRTRREILYADCNAVSPATAEAIGALFSGSAAGFVDVGIVGPAPRSGTSAPTRFYVSGPNREAVVNISVPEIATIDMGDSIGRASAIKMCYAAMNKGLDALFANILLGARRLGVGVELMREFEASQPEAAARMHRRIPFLAATARRYTGEMSEIAQTFDAVGVSGDFHRGAEWLYALLARSALAVETRASLPDERSLDEALEAFATVLEA
jgi:3-hydroxyisobutyrate dehydrogenase-like beta-hydroxyacid dehydrogenase